MKRNKIQKKFNTVLLKNNGLDSKLRNVFMKGNFYKILRIKSISLKLKIFIIIIIKFLYQYVILKIMREMKH